MVIDFLKRVLIMFNGIIFYTGKVKEIKKKETVFMLEFKQKLILVEKT